MTEQLSISVSKLPLLSISRVKTSFLFYIKMQNLNELVAVVFREIK